jgi:hypothetical protein
MTVKSSNPRCFDFTGNDDTNLVFRPLHHRIVDRFSHAHRAMAVMEKRALYPRVKLYGGLYCPRRPIKDDTLIREIKIAFDEFFKATQGEEGEPPLPEGFEDEQSSLPRSGKIDYPSHVVRRHTSEPTRCFGGGMSL